MGLREDNVERRRQRILAAARELIARDGIGGWSMRKVASAADVSVPTLYNLFGSKEEIRSAMCEGFFDALDRDLDDDASFDRPLERAFAFVVECVDHIVSQAELTRPVLLAQEQGRGAERHTTPHAVERSRLAIQAAMDDLLLHSDLRADVLAAQAFEGFHRAALLWARHDLDTDAFRAKALYATCLCLLAVATDAVRPELLETARGLEEQLTRNSERETCAS